MKALVAAAAALAMLWCGAPALAAPGSGDAGAPVASSQAAKATKKGKAVRIATLSTSKPQVGGKVVVKGRTALASRKVVLQVRRTNARGHRWVTVDRGRSKKGAFKLATRVKHADVDRVRVVAPRTKKASRAVTPARKLKVRVVRAPAPKPKPAPTAPETVEPTPEPEITEPAPALPAPVVVDARAVEAELAGLVRSYRGTHGRTAVGSDACLATWAQGFAATMAMTGLFAHSSSPEWEGAPHSILRACQGGATPAFYRQEAIARVLGDSAAEVASAAMADLQAAWMHDDVLLDDAGTGRVLQVGAAQDGNGEWFVVVAFAAAP